MKHDPDDDIPDQSPAPHVHAGLDFQTKMTIQMEYLVKEVERQGRILGNGKGLISDVRHHANWIGTRSRIEWILISVAVGSGFLWLAAAIWKVAKL